MPLNCRWIAPHFSGFPAHTHTTIATTSSTITTIFTIIAVSPASVFSPPPPSPPCNNPGDCHSFVNIASTVDRVEGAWSRELGSPDSNPEHHRPVLWPWESHVTFVFSPVKWEVWQWRSSRLTVFYNPMNALGFGNSLLPLKRLVNLLIITWKSFWYLKDPLAFSLFFENLELPHFIMPKAYIYNQHLFHGSEPFFT